MKQSQKKKLDYLIRRPLPVLKNTVFFQSFGGQYNDNPKYISEELHRINPDLHLVWAISDKSGCQDIPDYITAVRTGSKEYVRYSTRSQVIVDNMSGIRGFVSSKKRNLLPKLFTRKSQLNISTWHGTPLKKIGLQIPGMEGITHMYTSAAYISAGNEYTAEKFRTAFHPTVIKSYGSPRNDLLINLTEGDRQALKEKLGLPPEKKILLFAPTFRQSVEESGIRQMKELDAKALFAVLSEQFGGEWCLVFRSHHEVMKQIDVKQFKNLYGEEGFCDGNRHDDMAEYLAAADVLLTDYSSSLFDFALTKCPCFLLTLDRKHYIEDERGVYMSMDDLPYSYADSCEELYQQIRTFDAGQSEENIIRFLDRIGNKEDGNASKRISEDILSFLQTGRIQSDKTI